MGIRSSTNYMTDTGQFVGKLGQRSAICFVVAWVVSRS